MNFILVVTSPFSRYKRGDVIEDTIRIEEIAKTEHRACVVRVTPELASRS